MKTPRFLNAVVLLLAVGIASAPAQPQPPSRKEVIRGLIGEISALLLGDSSPQPVDQGKGWRMFAFAPPGTSLSPLLLGLGPQAADRSDIGRTLQNLQLYDRPFTVAGGFARPSEVSLFSVWKELVAKGVPNVEDLDEAILHDKVLAKAYQTLYRQGDRIDLVRGVRFIYEPSDNLIRYRTYQAAEQLINVSEITHREVWRTHPLFADCITTDDAKKKLSGDWVQFGLKQQIEKAFAVLNGRPGMERWFRWSSASQAVKSGSEDGGKGVLYPSTHLFPSPAIWSDMSGWMRFNVQSGMKEGSFSFECARISIVRPWFDPEALINESISLTDRGVVSDGTKPTSDSSPAGSIGAFAEEIVLIRNVKLQGSVSLENHPLSTIATPSSINLLGFILRTMPLVPKAN